MKYLIPTILLISSISFAGHREGNGGDYVRGQFLRMGEIILEFLNESQDGRRIASSHQLNLEELESQLNIEVVKTSSTPLIDNGGSRVHAIGEPGSITLHEGSWLQFLFRNRDVYYLIFHEMLRASSVNDDNYVISKKIHPFDLSYRKRLSAFSSLPILEGEQVFRYLDVENATFGGRGCRVRGDSSDNLIVDYDFSKNTLSLFPTQYEVESSGATNRSTCSFSIPLNLPSNKKLVVSQVDAHSTLEQGMGDSAQLSLEVFLAGSRSPRIVRPYQGPVSGSSLVRQSSVMATECGENSSLLRLNSSLRTRALGERSSARVNEMRFYFQLDDCD